MKALSVRQPWAWLIVHRYKDVENRVWYTTYRGPVLIHASKGLTRREYDECALFMARVAGPPPSPALAHIILPGFGQLERGGIVGRANIVDCVEWSASPWFVGPFGFVLGEREALPFRECKGALGLFEVQVAAPRANAE